MIFVQLKKIGLVYKFLAFSALLWLSACGWVDSTGTQEDPSGSNTGVVPALIDSSLVVLNEGDSFSINENTQRTVAFGSADSLLSNWSWKLLDGQANVRSCERFDDFDQTIASNSLSHSCTNNDSCNIEFEEQVIDNMTRFSVTTPQLRAPAALEFQFNAVNRFGEPVERRQLLCAIPINEAPDAVDDLVTIMRGDYLSVSGDDDQSLLANDTDDEDIRNLSLTVNTTAIEEPLFAANFQLFSDGGFIYEPKNDAPQSKNGSISDRFVYSVTDGSHTSFATVSIKIADVNTAPTLIAELPEIQAVIAGGDNDITLFNFRYYFSDAEFDLLNFTAMNNALPESGNIYITNEGLLKGNPTESDSGRYFVKLTATDSIASVNTDFYLNIVRDDGTNTAPYASDINNKTVRNQFSYDITGFFSDADRDHLTFTSPNLPEDVKISPDGIIYGTSTENNRGNAIVRVFANDGNGGINSDGFLLRIR